MNKDKDRSGEEFSVACWNRLCPLCNSSNLQRTKGTPGDWVREFTCNECNSVIEYNEGDKMGGQFDYITIIKDNHSKNPENPTP